MKRALTVVRRSLYRGGVLLGLGGVAVGCGAEIQPRPPAPPRISEGALDGSELLASAERVAIEAGASGLEVVAMGAVSEGDRVGGFVETPPADGCLVVVARSNPEVADVDVYAFDDAGTPVGIDEGPEASASLVLCNVSAPRVYLAGRAVSGTGFLAVGAAVVPAHLAADLREALGARGASIEQTGRLSAWEGLEELIAARRRLIGSRFFDVRRMVLPVSASAPSFADVSVLAGRCVDVLISPGNEVGALDARVHDEAGRLLATLDAWGRERVIVLCSDRDATVGLRLRPRRADGAVALVVGRSEPGAEREIAEAVRVHALGAPLSIDERKKALGSAMGPEAYGPADVLGSYRVQPGIVSVGAVPSEPGCQRIDAVVGEEGGPVALELWTDGGRRVDRAEGAESAALFTCGRDPRQLELSTLAAAFDAELVRRPLVQVPQAFVDEPVAAGRLLGRLAAELSLGDRIEPVRVETLRLEEGAAATARVPVPSFQCVMIAAGLGLGGSGIELWLRRDAERELRRAGEVAAGDVVCAERIPQTVEVEVRLRQGRATGLLYAHPMGALEPG